MKNTISIKDEQIFQRVITKGQWYGGDFLSVYVLPSNEDNNQIGLGIGKKVGKAYKRNKVKRWIRESYTKLENNMQFGYYIVFVWKNKALYEDADFIGIDSDLKKTLKKAGII